MLDVFWHDDVLLHDTGSGVFEAAPSPLLAEPELHPENAVRLLNMKAILERGPLSQHVRWREGRHADTAELAAVHDPAYVESIGEACAAGGGRLTSTTVVSEGSWQAALAAAGTALAATEAVLSAECRLAFALVRPPGHHAQPAQADGYCLHATLEGVLGLEPSLEDPCAWMLDDPDVARPAIAAGRAALGPYWPV